MRMEGEAELRDPPLPRTSQVVVEEAGLVEAGRERGVDLSTFFGYVVPPFLLSFLSDTWFCQD